MFNTADRYDRLSVEFKEVDSHLEVTPGSRNKEIQENQGLTPLRESRREGSVTSFNGAYNQHIYSENKNKSIDKLSHRDPNQKIKDVYMKRDNYSRKMLTPLKNQRPATRDVWNSSRKKGSPINDKSEDKEIKKSRLSKVYVRENSQRSGPKKKYTLVSTHTLRYNQNFINSAGKKKNDAMNSTISSFGYTTSMNISKPIDRSKLWRQIYRLPSSTKEEVKR